jgi:ACR3 family arsenite transporter
MGADTTEFHISMGAIARSVGIFLGVPLAAGVLTRVLLVRLRGEAWYETRFLPRLGPTALLGLLYTIVLMFSMQGEKILERPLDVLRIAIPLLVYFGVIFSGAAGRDRLHLRGPRPCPSPPPGFELAIAVSIGLFGIAWGGTGGRRRPLTIPHHRAGLLLRLGARSFPAGREGGANRRGAHP